MAVVKGDLKGKWRCLEDFPRIFYKKFETFSVDVFKKLLQDQSGTSHAVSKLDFSPKFTGCHVVAVKSLFWRPKMGRKYVFRETSVCRTTF